MKKVLALLFTLLLVTMAGASFAATITFSMPGYYGDGVTPIASADQARITTKIFHGSTSGTCSTQFASNAAGVTTWTGTLPVVTKGSTTYYCMTATLDGQESVKSTPTPFTIPFGSPGPPNIILIQQ